MFRRCNARFSPAAMLLRPCSRSSADICVMPEYPHVALAGTATTLSAIRCSSSSSGSSSDNNTSSKNNETINPDEILMEGDPSPAEPKAATPTTTEQQRPPASHGDGNFQQQMESLGAAAFANMARSMQQATTSSSSSGGGGALNPLAGMFSAMASMAEEKEWECWCGHKFRAPGMWIPCDHSLCQAPGCPNPKYFIEGEGAKKLDAGMGGTPLKSKVVPPKQ